MSDSMLMDLYRELSKARLALVASQTHLAAHAESNAALHCATTVMYSPLHATVTNAIHQIEQALLRAEPGLTALDDDSTCRLLAAVLFDLDRCEHGRHAQDNCGGCPGDQSTGNLLLPVGMRIGTGLYAIPIVVPPVDQRADVKAWRGETRRG